MPGPLSLPAGYRLMALGAIGSSNDEACREADRGAPEGTLFWAESQSAGRGRRGRQWISPPGNLYLSLILRPRCIPAAAPQLSLIAALALAEAVEGKSPGLAVGCKWPNDLVVAGRKLAGLLLESASGGDGRLGWVVVGVGLNVAHHPELDASDSQRATSLAAEGVRPLPALEGLISGFAQRFDAHYALWRKSGFAPARAAWLARAAGLCEEIELRLEGEALHGRFEGLTEGGELVLSLPAGTRRHLAAGEVRLLRAAKAGEGSMLLAIDEGNTNTVFAAFEGDRLVAQWRIATDARRTAEEYAVWLSQLMGLENLGFAAIDAAIISTVVPQGLRALVELARRYVGADPLVVGPGLDLGIRVAVPRPEEVGADRLVNAVAACERYRGHLILVDFGTATTFDAVGEGGVYEGGVIAPGINLSLQALHQAAAMLPRIAIEKPARVVGEGTITAMQSGIYWGYVGLIEGIVSRMKVEMARPVSVIATGGLAPLFADATSVIEHTDGDLTMRGLLILHRRNTRPRA